MKFLYLCLYRLANLFLNDLASLVINLNSVQSALFVQHSQNKHHGYQNAAQQLINNKSRNIKQ